MSMTEQVLRGPAFALAGAKVTVTCRSTVMALGTVIVAGIYPTAVQVVSGESTITFALPGLPW
jgi:uncharacterized membrane protein